MSDATKTNRGEGDIWEGLVAGVIGGLVASWTMNRFQDVWIKLSAEGQSTDAQSEYGKDSNEQQTVKSDGEEQDDTTVKAGSAISEGIFGHRA